MVLNFDPSWQAHDGIFGGLVASALVEAGACVDGYDPLSVTVQFMGAVRPGNASVDVTLVHQGVKTAAVALELVQRHRRATAALKLGRAPVDRVIDQRRRLHQLPEPGQIPPARMPYGPFDYERHLDLRIIPGSAVHGEERTDAWIRLSPDSEAATAAGPFALAALFLDALPPGLFSRIRPPVFVPTVDFTAHFAPAQSWGRGDWMFVARNTWWATRDFCLEDATLYTADGSLVAHGRQTRAVRWV